VPHETTPASSSPFLGEGDLGTMVFSPDQAIAVSPFPRHPTSFTNIGAIPARPWVLFTLGYDPQGITPVYQEAAHDRPLTVRQQEALRQYPLIPAVSRLLWRLYEHAQELTPDAQRLVSRVLFAAVKALEYTAALIDAASVDVQSLFGTVSVLVRDMARGLRRYARDAGGFLSVHLPAVDDHRLIESEAYDPVLSRLSPPPQIVNDAIYMINDLSFAREVG
jgi:hypothetical protein